LILLFCLFPLATYCLYLAFLNRGRHPALVRGTWDFAGVLLAASGFLILGGPMILNGLYEQRRLAWVLGGKVQFFPGLGGNDWFVWALFWTVYYLGLVAGSAWFLLRRRRQLSIYNVDADQLDGVLADALRRLGLEGVRMGNRLVIGAPHGTPPDPNGQALSARSGGSAPAALSAQPLAVGPATVGVLEIDPFPALRHVTLSWPEEPGPLQRDIEAELTRVLMETPPAQESVGGWFLAAALGLFCVTILGALLLIAAILLRVVR
jgi:hypothetical protein